MESDLRDKKQLATKFVEYAAAREKNYRIDPPPVSMAYTLLGKGMHNQQLSHYNKLGMAE